MNKMIFFVTIFSFFAQWAFAGESLDQIHLSIIKGEYGAAEDACDGILAHSRDDNLKDSALFYKGIALLARAEFDEARVAFGELLLKYPNSKLTERARLGIGDSYLLDGDYEAALKEYTELASKVPHTDWTGTVYYRIAETLKNLDRDDSAAVVMEKLNREWPGALATKQANRVIELERVIYTVQVGSFLNRDNAIRLCNKLQKIGHEAYILDMEEGARHYYRVRVGHVDSKGKAEGLASKLARQGWTTKIFP